MSDNFDITVIYKGNELIFNSKISILGYTHKIQVDVFGEHIVFEPDEERSYRAIIDLSSIKRDKKIDVELLKVISASIEEIVK